MEASSNTVVVLLLPLFRLLEGRARKLQAVNKTFQSLMVALLRRLAPVESLPSTLARLEPKMPETYECRGVLFAKMGRKADAEKDLATLRKLNSKLAGELEQFSQDRQGTRGVWRYLAKAEQLEL
jgi:hypothetical protein